MKKRYLAMASVLAYLAWNYLYLPPPTIISLRIGQPFNEVVQLSSFPVIASSNIPDNELGWGATWVKKPAVIIQFNDPRYGFILPPTKFAAISYLGKKVATVATTPMLEKMSFQAAATELASLQGQFQKNGWQLDNETQWFDLTRTGLEKLRRELRREGHAPTTLLRVPQKYGLTFRIYCADRCDSSIGLDRYLIDIGIGEDLITPAQEHGS